MSNSLSPDAAPLNGKPTRVRYLVVTLTMLSAVLLYLDRFCISFAERYIKEDLSLSNQQVGWMLSAFFLTYALAQVPSGFLADRFGARKMLTLYVLLWSLFTGLTGLATGFLMIVILRLGFGVAQAGAYPTSAGLLSKWVPFSFRGYASSLIAFGGRIGGFIAPILTAFMIVAFVPISTPSTLQPGDILNLPQLCADLVNADSPLGDRILAGMPKEYRSEIHRIAAAFDKDRPPQGNEDHDPLAVLVDRLNQLIDQPGLYQPDEFREIALPQEAKQLLEIPASELGQEENQRLNRLLLEAAYPEAIKKVYVAGWRPVMITYGVVGLIVAVMFWLFFRDRPEIHPWCNRAEAEMIEGSRPAGSLSPHGKARKVPLRQLITSASMWLMCVSQLMTNVGWVFLVTWLPRYLKESHQVPIEQRGWLAAIPLFVGWFGMLSGGWFTDYLTRRMGNRWGRALPISMSRFVAMSAYLFCLTGLGSSTAYWVTAAFAVVAFSTDFGSPSTWAFSQDVGGRYVGSVFAWGNMWGNLGAAALPPFMNWVVGEAPARWDLGFIVCATAFGISGLCALGINASIPIAPPEEDLE